MRKYTICYENIYSGYNTIDITSDSNDLDFIKSLATFKLKFRLGLTINDNSVYVKYITKL
jgi:hypothetical protein